ncbi:MAG: serine/threonine protein kinase [Clostridiales Family XIII bacterium]|jgi:hypothetical protein|nr:serine/threonine protein kinase [Clostridiales Family XIII bacterium]
MSRLGAFESEYSCEAPGFLPEELRARLRFVSCLAEKPDRFVYLVHDGASGAEAVLKVTLPGSPDTALREAELLGKLDHPSLPKALWSGADAEGREYLLREYAHGETLDRVLERDGVFGERHALEIVRAVSGIIDYLHAQTPPVIYRDVKPGNVLVTPNGKVSLIDFGVSREFRGGKDFDTVFLGTVDFAAPEQFGFRAADQRTDVFALGKLLLYLCTGETALPGFREKVGSKTLRRIIAKCTALSPEKRYASAGKLVQAIGRALSPPTRREYAIAAGAALAVVAAGIAALFPLLRPTDSLEGEGPGGGIPEALRADGSLYADEARVPVTVTALMDGEPFEGCAVSVDSHHWYAPAKGGLAELTVFAYDDYTVSAAYRNRVATEAAVVTKAAAEAAGEEGLAFTLDIALAPDAAEYTEESRAAGGAFTVPLPVTGADEVSLWGAVPAGFSVEGGGGSFALSVTEGAATPGHYPVFFTATNAFGSCDGALSLFVTDGREAAPVPVHTAEDLSRIRDNLSGHYVLEADIDCSALGVFEPIGTLDQPFTGVLEGGGHTIAGLRIEGNREDDRDVYGLFGAVENGVVRGVRLADVEILVQNDFDGAVGAVAGKNLSGLIEGCTVESGTLDADIAMGSSAGGICGVNSGIVRGCVNAAPVTIFTAGNSKNRTETYAGGVCGTNTGYVFGCGNTGGVTGISVAGGCAGILEGGVLTGCYNTGAVSAPDFMDAWKPGGVVHLVGQGRRVSDCVFLEGTAAVGVSVWNYGTVIGVAAVEEAAVEEFRGREVAGDQQDE